MLTTAAKQGMGVLVVLLLMVQAFMQVKIDPQRHHFEPGEANVSGAVKGLPIEFALGAAVGFREAVAGLLWVRTDEFFDDGDYEAITPMVRIVTWLDPHQIDVYETGAWHMDYNFTDSDQRSDRRYVPLSVALLDEGIANNPTVTNLYSDLGFTHYYRKIEDFGKAAETFNAGKAEIDRIMTDAAAHPDDPNKQALAAAASSDVVGVAHGLAHAYEGLGDIPDAITAWKYAIAMHQQNLQKHYGSSEYGEQASLDVAQKNEKEMEMRTIWRKDPANDPVDFHFDAQFIRKSPKVFLVRGTLQAIGANHFVLETGKHDPYAPYNGCRVEVRLQDADYKTPSLGSFSLGTLNLNNNLTILQDAISVRNGAFQKPIDMSQDKDMYTFKADKYTLTFWFNPSNGNDTPEPVQDRIGWLGQGLSDSQKYVDDSGVLPGDIQDKVPGLRYLKKTITLTRDDLLGQGTKTFE